jgi:hypothetical protein
MHAPTHPRTHARTHTHNCQQAYGVKVFDLLGEQGVASEGAMAIYAEFHAVVEELQKKLTEKQEHVEKIKEEEKTLFKS